MTGTIRSTLYVFTTGLTLNVVGVASVQSANLELTVDYAGSYDSTLTPLPGSPPAPLHAQNAPHSGTPGASHVPGAYHKFDVYMTITGLPAGEDFQSVAFDMLLGPGVTPSDFGWDGEDPFVDPPGPTGNGPVYSQNADVGPAGPPDLQFISVIANPAVSHARTHAAHPGEADSTIGFPTKLGSAYVFWDGTFGSGGTSFVGIAPTFANPSWMSITAGNQPVSHTQAEFTSGPREVWVAWHRPPFMVDDLTLVSGHLPGSLITAGPLSTNDDDDPDNGITWLLESFVGPDGPVVGAMVDPTGVFTWQSQPTSAKGTYTAVISGTNDNVARGSTGDLTFRIVPEPATLSLVGLAMLGVIGVVRRR